MARRRKAQKRKPTGAAARTACSHADPPDDGREAQSARLPVPLDALPQLWLARLVTSLPAQAVVAVLRTCRSLRGLVLQARTRRVALTLPSAAQDLEQAVTQLHDSLKRSRTVHLEVSAPPQPAAAGAAAATWQEVETRASRLLMRTMARLGGRALQNVTAVTLTVGAAPGAAPPAPLSCVPEHLALNRLSPCPLFSPHHSCKTAGPAAGRAHARLAARRLPQPAAAHVLGLHATPRRRAAAPAPRRRHLPAAHPPRVGQLQLDGARLAQQRVAPRRPHGAHPGAPPAPAQPRHAAARRHDGRACVRRRHGPRELYPLQLDLWRTGAGGARVVSSSSAVRGTCAAAEVADPCRDP